MDYDDAEKQAVEQSLEGQELQNEEALERLMAGGVDYPGSPAKNNLFEFFRQILKSKDTSKSANLNNVEMGTLPLGVRHYVNIANYANKEGMGHVAQYLRDKAELVNATSLSRSGFLIQAAVTQVRKLERSANAPKEMPKGFFGKKKDSEG